MDLGLNRNVFLLVPFFFFCLLVNSVQINYYYYAVLLLAEVKTHSSIRRDIQSCSRHLHNAIQ